MMTLVTDVALSILSDDLDEGPVAMMATPDSTPSHLAASAAARSATDRSAPEQSRGLATPAAERGDVESGRELGALFAAHEKRLLKIVAFRMDRRLNSRIDPADVLQETYLEAIQRYPEYQASSQMPFFLWLRFLTIQKLFKLSRFHLQTRARDARQDVSLDRTLSSQSSSSVLAGCLLGNLTSPSQAAMRGELRERVESKLEELEPIDREIIALRHFEQLSNCEAAAVLEIDPSAASNRFMRAIRRLKNVLEKP